MVMADNQDVFVEKLKTEQGILYSEYKGSWESVQMHYEQIAVKDQKPVAVPIRKTRNGTLIHDLLNENGKVGFSLLKLAKNTAWPWPIQILRVTSLYRPFLT